ncbi:MAG TPA: energy transducer TonB [Allosphingosinicella sp.]|nr:energy transducer TonB [Allosphingosinicella sp.]
MSPAFRPVGIALALAALSVPGPLSTAWAKEGRRAAPSVPLVSVLSDEDYPSTAIRNGEQGSVSFRLSITAAGRVSGCDILVSSGSAALDSTTCRLMATWVGFRPAEDGSGKPVADTYEGQIVWRLPASPAGRIDLPERPGAAIGLWSDCADGEAARLALSSLAAAEIAERAFRACRGLEERLVRELVEAGIEGLNAPRTVQALKDDYSERLGPRLAQVRSQLGPRGK